MCVTFLGVMLMCGKVTQRFDGKEHYYSEFS